MVDVRGESSFAFSTLFTKKEDIPSEYQKRSNEKYNEIIKTIVNPNEIVEEAITQCFRLFEIPEKNYKKFASEDGEIEFRDKSKILTISYKKVQKNRNSKIIHQKINEKNKIHAYDVDWVIFNVTWDKWSERIRKTYAFIISQGTSRVPGLGGLLGDFINKKIKETGDQWIIKGINYEFNEIFYSILKSNPAIEYIKYGKKKLIRTSDIS